MLKLSRKFILGATKCIDLFGLQREWPDVANGSKKDYESLREDWIRVGKTISCATSKCKATTAAT